VGLAEIRRRTGLYDDRWKRVRGNLHFDVDHFPDDDDHLGSDCQSDLDHGGFHHNGR
jgi:hypothetical protein